MIHIRVVKENNISQYDDIFKRIGCIPGQYSIKVNTNAVPVIHAARKIPTGLHIQLKSKLETLSK